MCDERQCVFDHIGFVTMITLGSVLFGDYLWAISRTPTWYALAMH